MMRRLVIAAVVMASTTAGLLTAGAGRVPVGTSRREGIPAKYIAQVRSDVRAVHRLKAEGEMGRARGLARELAVRWVDHLGEELQPGSTDAMRGEMDPARLARDISRW